MGASIRAVDYKQIQRPHELLLGYQLIFQKALCQRAQHDNLSQLIKGGVDPVPDYFTLRRNPHPERYEDEIIAQAFHSNKK